MTKVIHKKKLFGGRYTAEEVHNKFAFPPLVKCQNAGCGRRPEVRGIVMMQMAEALKNPIVALEARLDPQKFVEKTVQIKGSDGRAVPYFRMSTAYACKSCAPTMEKVLAKAPSHCIVEINRGPAPDRPQVGYGS